MTRGAHAPHDEQRAGGMTRRAAYRLAGGSAGVVLAGSGRLAAPASLAAPVSVAAPAAPVAAPGFVSAG